jgi:hypothetical protein
MSYADARQSTENSISIENFLVEKCWATLHMKEADCPHDNLKFVNLISPRRYLQLQV